MSILIKGTEMPKESITLQILPSGAVYCDGEMAYESSAVEIPPHGRLVDIDEFKADYHMGDDCAECEKEAKGKLRSCEYDRIYSKMDFCQWLDNAPTVIEAEGE